MRGSKPNQPVAGISSELNALLGSGRQVPAFSSKQPDFDLAAAYDVVAKVRDLREARGERYIGRKIGFTNTSIWNNYGISGPIWNYMFDSTVHELASINCKFPLSNMTEPRIEPEIVFHLQSPPNAAMNDDELLDCIDWVAHGFEIVFSIFPNWKFTAADAAAAYGMHGALLLSDKHFVGSNRTRWREELSNFKIALVRADGIIRQGHAGDVLGGPLRALSFLLRELENRSPAASIKQGEVITTGTLTEAMPALAGETWRTMFDGIHLPGARVTFL